MSAKKPIALITDSLAYAIQWALTNYPDNVDKYSSKRKEITLKDGEWFIVCTRPEDLLSVEIADYKDIGGNIKPASWFIDMIRLARSRIR